MKQKTLMFLAALVLIATVSSVWYIWQMLAGNPVPSEKYCAQDADCACGVSKATGDCFYGNKLYVDTTRQCPDFCTGIAGNLILKCVDNECRHISAP